MGRRKICERGVPGSFYLAQQSQYGADHVCRRVFLQDHHQSHQRPQVTLEADRVTYGTCLAVLDQAEEWQRSLEVLEKAISQGIEASGVLITSTMAPCVPGLVNLKNWSCFGEEANGIRPNLERREGYQHFQICYCTVFTPQVEFACSKDIEKSNS